MQEKLLSDEEIEMLLPDYLKIAITKVLEKYPEYKTKLGAKGECVTASDNLMFTCDIIVGDIVDARLTGNGNKKNPHHWAEIEGFCVDLTARQFDENDKCPKIWRDTSKSRAGRSFERV